MRWILAIYAAVILGMSQHLFVSDSELWAWNVGYNLSRVWLEPWFWDRALFFLPLGLGKLLTQDVWHSLLVTRSLGGLAGAFIVAFTAFVAIQVTRQRWLGVVAAAFLMSNYTFVSQSYRLRSDIFVMASLLFAAFLYLREKRGWALLVSFLALLFTPKAIVFCAPFWLLSLFRLPRQQRILISVILLSLGVLCAAYFHRYVFYTYDSFSSFWRAGGLRHNLVYYYLSNVAFWSLLFVFAILSIFKRPKFSSQEKFFLSVGVYFFILVFVFPEPHQFFLAALAPAWCVSAVILLNHALKNKLEHIQKLSWISLGFALLLSAMTIFQWMRYSLHSGPSLTQQIQYFQAIDDFAGQHRLTHIYDGVGAFPHRAKYMIYLGPHQGGESDGLLELLQGEPPDILLATPRFIYLPNYRQALQWYKEVVPGVYLSMWEFHRTPIPSGRLRTYADSVRQTRQFKLDLSQKMVDHRFPMSMQTVFWARRFDGGKVIEGEDAAPQAMKDLNEFSVNYRMIPKVELKLPGEYELSDYYRVDH